MLGRELRASWAFTCGGSLGFTQVGKEGEGSHRRPGLELSCKDWEHSIFFSFMDPDIERQKKISMQILTKRAGMALITSNNRL